MSDYGTHCDGCCWYGHLLKVQVTDLCIQEEIKFLLQVGIRKLKVPLASDVGRPVPHEPQPPPPVSADCTSAKLGPSRMIGFGPAGTGGSSLGVGVAWTATAHAIKAASIRVGIGLEIISLLSSRLSVIVTLAEIDEGLACTMAFFYIVRGTHLKR
jgi:hypothetical protein